MKAIILCSNTLQLTCREYMTSLLFQATVDTDDGSRSSLKTPPLPKIAEVAEAASELARYEDR